MKRLQADIAEIYPQLGEVAVEHVWSGVLGNALHRMPQIGELSPGLWLASGFGGHGLNTTAMAGNILAQAIVEGDDTWRLFAPFELVWAGGRLGRAAMQVYYWWFDARERFEARQARQREQEYRRVAELAALRAGEEGSDVEATLGAVVPREELPEEPTLAELPADPVEAPPAALATPDLIRGSGQRGDSLEVRAHSASEDARERADDTRPDPGSSARDDGRHLAPAICPISPSSRTKSVVRRAGRPTACGPNGRSDAWHKRAYGGPSRRAHARALLGAASASGRYSRMSPG